MGRDGPAVLRVQSRPMGQGEQIGSGQESPYVAAYLVGKDQVTDLQEIAGYPFLGGTVIAQEMTRLAVHPAQVEIKADLLPAQGVAQVEREGGIAISDENDVVHRRVVGVDA